MNTGDLIKEARNNGTKFIAITELLIPRYPTFIHARTSKIAVEVGSNHREEIHLAPREANIMSQAQICGLITVFSHNQEGCFRLPFCVVFDDSDAAFGIWVPAMLVKDNHDFSLRFRCGLTVGVLVVPCCIGKILQLVTNHRFVSRLNDQWTLVD